MKSPLRLLPLAFALTFLGQSLRPAEAGDVYSGRADILDVDAYIGYSRPAFRDGRYRERLPHLRPVPAAAVPGDNDRLGNKAASIPFYAIFPGGSSHTPILLDGLLTGPEPIVNALRQAGPSRPMLASNLKIAPASGNDAGGF